VVFSYQILTPASTLESAPLITSLPISKGIIKHWHIAWREGADHSTPLRIMKGGSAILPINPDESIQGDVIPFVSEEWINIGTSPYELQAYTWNSDAYNSHVVYIYITIMPLWTMLPYSNQLLELMDKDEVKLIF
jgi:hypothetical protein